MTRYKSNYSYSQDLRDLRQHSMEIARERDTLKTQITELQTRIMLLDVDMWELRKENERLQDELNLANEALRRAFKPQ